MGRINLLDTEISNKIAAGEVVERPASVVKELVENSIDANATRICVEIKNGGNTYIKISDNGFGMEKDDASVAFLRHATSKIEKEEDLDAIYTLGFRGEALSSIGAVSKVSLFTKRKEDRVGTHTICEGGEIISEEDAGIPDGTTFIVKNLFYNVPARMKFLKKDATEAGYISDIMQRFILSHPEISFTFISNNKTVMSSSGDGNIINAIYAVYGKDYAKTMIPVDFETENVKVKGMIGPGSVARANRSYQSFFVNSRYIKSPLMTRAVEEAYKNQIMIGKFPVLVLNVEINPMLIDINVHPTKLEVKFSDDNEIYRALYHSVKEALYKITDVPKIEKKEIPLENIFKKDNITIKQQEEINFSSYQKEEKKEIQIENKPFQKVAEPLFFDGHRTNKERESLKIFEEILKNNKIAEEKTQEIPINEFNFKIVGQIFDTYIIIECDDEIKIIDQHAAHERIGYEELKKDIENEKLYSQALIVGEVVSLTASEMAIFKENREILESLGFVSEEYGEQSVIIREVPVNINEDIENLFIEILSQIGDNKREIISEKRQRLLYTIACKKAIKANHKLSGEEQEKIIRDVFSLDKINTCPHGRPIVISMSKKEIEKEFKRIV